jgi:mRNA-degrading endonuclease RelE of RelBE toxin-antitoxin system
MRVLFCTAAEDPVERLPRYLQKRILSKIEIYIAQPDPLKFAEPLSGSSYFRFRVGNYRVIFEILYGGAFWVLAIERRDEAYR